MQYSTRLPATPLITHDPYFSIWAPGDTPTAEDTVHWSGTRKILRGSILVDGVERGFLSRGLRQAMRWRGYPRDASIHGVHSRGPWSPAFREIYLAAAAGRFGRALHAHQLY